jgi:hypothetical protein
MGLPDFLRARRAAPVTLAHPVFGTLVQDGPGYWMHEGDGEGDLVIGIPTRDGAAPSEAQAAFFRRATSDVDALYARAAPLLGRNYTDFCRKPAPVQWRQAFRFSGIGLPLDGDDTQPWDLTFECLEPDAGALFTCYFVDGCPVNVSIDD